MTASARPIAAPRTDTVARTALRPATGRAILTTAALLGIAGDSLLRDGPGGIAFPLWVGVVALNGISLVWKDGRRVPLEPAAWLTAAFAFAATFAWGNSSLQFLDFLAVASCLTLAAIALAAPESALGAPTVRRLLDAALRVVRVGAAGFAPLVIADLRHRAASDAGKEVELSSRDRWRPIVRSTAIALVLIAIFGALLRSADPIFASLVSLPDFDAGVVIGHVLFSAFLAWLVAGWIHGALHHSNAHDIDPPAALRIGSAEVSTALGSLNVLFALFVATQVAVFFGGERFLREHTGLTAAAYARTGFFQMVWVVALVVPVLLGTRAMLRPDASLIRRHTMLALPLLALLAAIVLSAVLRMKMYVHFYGLTTDRLYPLVFMGWVAFVLLGIAVTVLRNRAGLVRGSMVSGFAVLAALNILDPDAYVARVNIDRAAHLGAEKLDVVHLATLRGGAVPLTVPIVLDARRPTPAAQRCTAAHLLIGQWGATSPVRRRATSDAAWRFWNADDRLAMRTVESHAAELRSVVHEACAAAKAAAPASPAAAASPAAPQR